MKKVIVCLSLLFFLCLGTSFREIPRRYEIKTIVIDAGHGGHDTGCLGSSAREKDIALDISLKLGRLIQENYPDIKVIYTRKSDVFVELHERAEIANRNRADLFICIHANSGGSAYGTETFVLGLHRAEENLAVSKRENSAILLEKDYKTQYDGFDPNSPEANIIFRLHQNTYLQQSLLFAAKVQDQLSDYAGRLNRGVKQAGLLVLARTTMPGVLIETGFLTNKEEEKYLLSSKGQHQVSTAIYRAFKEYKIDMEETPENVKKEALAKTVVVPPAKVPEKDTLPKQVENTKKEAAKPVREADKKPPVETVNLMDPLPEPRQQKKEPEPEKIQPPTPKVSDTAGNNAGPNPGTGTISTAPKDSGKNVKETPVVAEKAPVENKKPEVKKSEESEPNTAGTDDPQVVFFTIQLGAVDHPTSKDLDRYKSVKELQQRTGEDGMTRFTAGTYFSLDKAILAQQEMRNKGFKDAFVTAYNKNKRITIKEAANLSKNK